jgi:hypothetical protein
MEMKRQIGILQKKMEAEALVAKLGPGTYEKDLKKLEKLLAKHAKNKIKNDAIFISAVPRINQTVTDDGQTYY